MTNAINLYGRIAPRYAWTRAKKDVFRRGDRADREFESRWPEKLFAPPALRLFTSL
jgi:hypothetical protein